MFCLQNASYYAKVRAAIVGGLLVPAFTLSPFCGSALAFPVYVDAKDNCISVDPSQFEGGAPVWVTGLTDRYCLFTITENSSRWYPGGPSFGEVFLHFERVASVGNIPVPMEGSSPVDLYQTTLEMGDQILIEFQELAPDGYLGHFSAFVSDSGNQDNSGGITIEVTPLNVSATDPTIVTDDLISMQVRPSVGSGHGMTLSLDSALPLGHCNIGIFDANGRLVADLPVNDATREVSLASLGLRSGVYFANLISQEGVLAHRKFTIVK